MCVNADQIEELFQSENAIWFFNHNGDPKAPHAELTSGLCSDGFINCRLVLANTSHVQWIARKLVTLSARR